MPAQRRCRPEHRAACVRLWDHQAAATHARHPHQRHSRVSTTGESVSDNVLGAGDVTCGEVDVVSCGSDVEETEEGEEAWRTRRLAVDDVLGGRVVDEEFDRPVRNVRSQRNCSKHCCVKFTPSNVTTASHEVCVRRAPTTSDAAVDCDRMWQLNGWRRGLYVHSPPRDARIRCNDHCLWLCPQPPTVPGRQECQPVAHVVETRTVKSHQLVTMLSRIDEMTKEGARAGEHSSSKRKLANERENMPYRPFERRMDVLAK